MGKGAGELCWNVVRGRGKWVVGGLWPVGNGGWGGNFLLSKFPQFKLFRSMSGTRLQTKKDTHRIFFQRLLLNWISDNFFVVLEVYMFSGLAVLY